MDPYERAALVLDDGREIRFRDVRKFGRIGLYAADDDPFDDLGPEPLDPRFTLRAWRARLRGRRARLKPLLVDQSFVVGIGNIYADEALWRSRLHPLRSAASLRPADERALYRNVLEILGEAVERRGSSIDDYTAPDGDGEMQERLDVYQRTGQPCPRCGRPIRRIVIGIRATHFCSFCQRLPAAERPAAAKLLATMTPAAGAGGVRPEGPPVGGARRRRGRSGGRPTRPPWPASGRRGRRRRPPPDGPRRGPGRRDRGGGAGARIGGRRRDEPGPPGGRRPGDRHLRHPRPDRRRHRRRRARSASSGPTAPARRRCSGSSSGRDEADRGTVTRRRHLSLGLLSQEAHFDEAFMAAPDLRAAVRHGAAHLEKMAVELEHLEHGGHAGGNRYADLQHRFEILGGYTLDQRVDEALSGLGFARDEWLRPPTALSGGQQTRAALARLVVADPDLLLLDEPTNHLDINAIEWLEEHLRRRSGALLVASHDRAFLDATVTRVWELRDRRLTVFRGDYSAYHRQRVERDLRAEKDAETQSDAIEREVELVQRYRSQRKHTKMHEHEARLEKLKADRVEAPRKSSRTLRLHGHAIAGGPVRSGELVVRMDDMAVGYLPGRGALNPDGSEAPEPVTVARAPFLAAQRGERIGIVGPNGAGKTTLLRTIAGDLPPLDGMIAFGHQVQPGYLAQLRDAAIPGATVLDAILEAIPVTPGEARGYLARFLFRGDDVFKEVRALSGGERSRLELALLGILPANLLLLDEPTNHLDIAAREAIEAFFAETPGDAAGGLARPPAPGDDLRAAVGGRRGAGGAVRRRLPGLAPGGGGRLDRGGRGEPAPEPAPTGRSGHAGVAPGAGPGPPAGRKGRAGDGAGRGHEAAAARVATPRDAPRRPAEAAPEAVQGGLPAPPRGRRRASWRASACARASWSWRSARRRSRPTSSRCAG